MSLLATVLASGATVLVTPGVRSVNTFVLVSTIPSRSLALCHVVRAGCRRGAMDVIIREVDKTADRSPLDDGSVPADR
ncbi:hypothetical protein VTN31DRAFT_5162 [Thermomyces dupontii]|uniref:uncharacterized protein n=1 Tax=Talaromyces thermophilus TaxID=28565 RepID=UPI00374495B9